MLDLAALSVHSVRHAWWVLVRHRLWTLLHGRSFYVVATGGLILLATVVGDFLSFVTATGLAVSRDPLRVPLTILLNLAAVYLSLLVAVGISLERQQGTLLVLSFGPVTPWSYLLSWLAAEVLAYLIFCGVVMIGLAGVVVVAGLGFSPRLIALMVLSALTAMAIVTFGMWVGSLSRDTRGSILIFLAIGLVLVVIEALHAYFGSLQPEQLSGLLLPISRTVGLLSRVVTWISPFSYLPRGLRVLFDNDWVDYGLASIAALAYSAGLLFLARVSLERRGVQP
ncbi:MAG: ABC transporter permease [Anaerolineae bacterium]